MWITNETFYIFDRILYHGEAYETRCFHTRLFTRFEASTLRSADLRPYDYLVIFVLILSIHDLH